MRQSRDEWKHRYGQMDDLRISAESENARLRERAEAAERALEEMRYANRVTEQCRVNELNRAESAERALEEMRAALLPISKAYPDDPGTSDLDNEQPVTITLGDVRRVWRALSALAAKGGAANG